MPKTPQHHQEHARMARRFAQFDADFRTLVNYLPANAARLRIQPQQVAALTQRQQAWAGLYAVYTDPLRHTAAAVMDVQREYRRSLALIRGVQRQVKNDPSVQLTGADYECLGIHPDKPTRTRTPRQRVAPDITPAGISPRRNRFSAAYPRGKGGGSRRMPYRNRLRIVVAFMPPGGAQPPGAGDFQMVLESGNHNFVVMAPAGTPPGALGYVKACYVNSRGEAGPYCRPMQFVVN